MFLDAIILNCCRQGIPLQISVYKKVKGSEPPDSLVPVKLVSKLSTSLLEPPKIVLAKIIVSALVLVKFWLKTILSLGGTGGVFS